MKLNKLSPTSFETRDYQKEALGEIRKFFGNWVRGILDTQKNTAHYSTAALIHMATGTGKTFTVGTFLARVFEIQRKFENLFPNTHIPPLNILVLNDKIAQIKQLKADFITGNLHTGKPSLIGTNLQKNISVEEYHSNEKEEKTHDNTEKKKNKIVFSTFQSALNISNPQGFNMILVDEAHHLCAPQYKKTFEKFYIPYSVGSDAQLPIVFAMTATPDEELKTLVGESVVDFSLARYIGSKYSPHIEYNIVSSSEISQKVLGEIHNEFLNIKAHQHSREKKQRLLDLKDKINTLLSSLGHNNPLINDIMARIPNIAQEKTLIFVPSIKIANELTHTLNQNIGENIASAYHSQSEMRQTGNHTLLDDFRNKDSTTKIIVCVNKLNEGIDMPLVDNVVFWRATDSSTLFHQQFGRGLRGENIKFYDYVGGIKNFMRIDDLVSEIKDITDDTQNIKEKFRLTLDKQSIDYTQTQEKNFEAEQIDMYMLIGEIKQYMEILNLPLAKNFELIELFQNGYIPENVLSKRGWKIFSKEFNQSLARKFRFRLPESWKFLKTILGAQHGAYVIKILKGEEIEHISKPIASQKDIRDLYEAGHLNIEKLTRRQYPFAIKAFQEQYGASYLFTLPPTWNSFCALLGITKDFRNRKNIESLFSTGKKIEGIKQTKANMQQIQDLYKRAVITRADLTSKKWQNKAIIIEKEHGLHINQSFEGLLHTLIGEQHVNALKQQGKKVLRSQNLAIHLLEGKKFEDFIQKFPATRENLISIKDKLLPHLSDKKLKIFTHMYAQKFEFIIPSSMNGLVSSLGGDKKIGGVGEAYVRKLFENNKKEM